MKVERIGVVGAGQMGSGIAHVCALAGYDVLLEDVNQSQLEKATQIIDHNLHRQVHRGVIGEKDATLALGHIHTTPTMEGFRDCDLVIEAATENEQVKRKIFQELCPVLKADAVVATNTSSISITRLASSTDRPERFIGLHFMNPVPLMQLVEVIKGIATGQETFETTMDVVKRLGKTPANAEDFPAFIVNRILQPMINEAVYTLYEGVGNVEAIDTAMRLGANHPMGPLELADFIGLDTCLSVMQVLYEGLADFKYRPCPLLVKYVEAGWLGRKSGRGFYDYRGEKPVPDALEQKIMLRVVAASARSVMSEHAVQAQRAAAEAPGIAIAAIVPVGGCGLGVRERAQIGHGLRVVPFLRTLGPADFAALLVDENRQRQRIGLERPHQRQIAIDGDRQRLRPVRL